MKTTISALTLLVFLSVSCTKPIERKPELLAKNSSADYTGPIIDMHIHAFEEGNPMFGMTHPTTLRGETYTGVTSAAEQKEKTLEKFRKHNIVKAMVSNGQLWFNEAPEIILIGEAGQDTQELRSKHQKGKLQVIAEMAPFYSGILADDPTLWPYFELAQELDIPVGFHLLPGGPNNGFHTMPEMLGGMRTYNAKPSQIENVLVKFPDLKIYLMHGGWPFVEDIKALMYAHPNVYVDISVVNWILPQEELNSYLKSLINAGFGNRIMFGSDQMVWPEIIDIAVRSVNSVDFLTLEQKEDIFFNNAAKFLRLTEEEIRRHKNR
jgi:uncharacterized protein